LSNILDAIEAFKRGEIIIVTDDEDRENEGDFVMAAEKVTLQKIAFIVKHSSGLITVPMSGKRLDELGLPMMVNDNTDAHCTAFTVSVDYKKGTTTGISAADRAATIKALINPKTKSHDLARPGHIFPLRAREGGVLKRAGHTEASVDLARLAGLNPAGVICEIVKDDGSMARMPDLTKFAKKHKLQIITIQDLIEYRRQNEKLIELVSEAELPTEYGDFHMKVYKSLVDGKEHVALVMGDIASGNNVLTRVHSECLTGDILGSKRCDCGPQLKKALNIIKKHGSGVFLYMRDEGRGIGLTNKIKSYKLQDKGLDTVQANKKLGFKMDLREYGIGAQILVDLGIQSLQLLTNNPTKIVGLEGYGKKINKRIPIETKPNVKNIKYLKTKKKKMGHILNNL